MKNDNISFLNTQKHRISMTKDDQDLKRSYVQVIVLSDRDPPFAK